MAQVPKELTGGGAFASTVTYQQDYGNGQSQTVNETTYTINEFNALWYELLQLEGIHGQNPESGAGIGDGTSYLNQYTNRVFGAPFQLLPSVDGRFESINPYLGTEYMRNFILNSPILTIKPGMPRYTGGSQDMGDKIFNTLKDMYFDSRDDDGISGVESFLLDMAKGTVFSVGSKLQKRLFGFRETYWDYIQYVNYMCRSVASFLTLTTGEKFPNGTFGSTGFKDFATFNWQNYRMLSDSVVDSPYETWKSQAGAVFEEVKAIGTTIKDKVVSAPFDIMTYLGILNGESNETIQSMLGIDDETVEKAWEAAKESGISAVLSDKIAGVQFIVDPIQFNESIDNQTATSSVESTVDGLTELGTEIAFLSGAQADFGTLGGVMEFTGATLETALQSINGLVANVTGGFLSNVFSGAIQSIKGQKMIYPEIYRSSESSMDYEFDITLTSPYGDIYNYYMNILVPLMHLIALAAPRMVTANSIASPFIVQAYIPGMCTCQLGIIQNLSITKNPSEKHVSVNGFPLTVKVHIKLKELYNALSISPANDPASFLFNETLNDYMANLAGLIPSIDVYTANRKNAFTNLGNYLNPDPEIGGWVNDLFSSGIPILGGVEDFENMFNPLY